MSLEARLVQAGLDLGMTQDEAERAARDAVQRRDWRLRRSGKPCSSCETWKPLTEFGRDSTRRDGLEPRCRACRSVNAADLPLPRRTS